MGTYGTYTGIVRWFDPVTEQGYLLSLLDGEIQASMIGEGITAADGNIVLDATGQTLHDMSGASIITPTFGVGMVHDTLPGSEDFTLWTAVGSASVTANAVICPDGVSQIADTIDLPAVNDELTQLAIASPTLADGQSAAFMIWLKGASAGTVTLWAKAGAGGTTLGTLTANVLSVWRRFALIVTNSTGSACRVEVGIKRSTSDLASVYAWGAQCAYDVTAAIPYYPYNPGGNKLAGTSVRGALFVSTGNNFEVAVGNNWTTLPSGGYSTVIGSGAGNGASGINLVAVGVGTGNTVSGANCVVIGHDTGAGSSGGHLIAMGENAGSGNSGASAIMFGQNAGVSNTFDKVVLIGTYASATANAQIVFGSDSHEYTDLYGGGGVVHDSPPDWRINATGGLGTNIAGGALKLAGGRGTGTGAGGSVVVQTAPAGASGSSQNALVDRITVAADGSIDFHNNTINNWAGPGGTGSVTRWRLMFGA